jgi:hypothetical protein
MTDLPIPQTQDNREWIAWQARNLARAGKPLDEAWVAKHGPKIQALIQSAYADECATAR